jgi:hypothetical protein
MMGIVAAGVIWSAVMLRGLHPARPTDEAVIESGVELLDCVMPVVTEITPNQNWVLIGRKAPPFERETLVEIINYEDGHTTLKVSVPSDGRILDTDLSVPATCGDSRKRVVMHSCELSSVSSRALREVAVTYRRQRWPIPSDASEFVHGTWYSIAAADRQNTIRLEMVERSELLKRSERHPASLLLDKLVAMLSDCLRPPRDRSPGF